MPHDKNGNLVELHDRVLVEFVVESVQPGHEFCNLTLRTVERMPGNDSTSVLVINTKQCNKIVPCEEVEVPCSTTQVEEYEQRIAKLEALLAEATSVPKQPEVTKD